MWLFNTHTHTMDCCVHCKMVTRTRHNVTLQDIAYLVPSQVKTQDLPCHAHRTHSAKSRTVLTTAQKSPSVQLPRTVVQPRHPQPSEIHNPSEYIILVPLRRDGGWEERLKALLPTAPHGLMSRTWHSDNFPIFWLVSERRDVWTKWPVRTQDAKSVTESDCTCT